MKLTIRTIDENSEGFDYDFEWLEIVAQANDGSEFSLRFSCSDDCPEDRFMTRDFSDVFRIPALIQWVVNHKDPLEPLEIIEEKVPYNEF